MIIIKIKNAAAAATYLHKPLMATEKGE